MIPVSREMKPEGEAKPLTTDSQGNVQGIWTADGRDIVFRSNRSGVGALWRMRAQADAKPNELPFGAGSNPAISKKGDRLAYVQHAQDVNIWRVSLSRLGGAAPEATAVVASTAVDANAQVSPNGKKIVFASDRSGGMEIWAANSDGSQAVQITTFGRHSGTPRWAPDSRRIVFDSNASGSFQLYTADIEGGAPRQITSGGTENSMPSWSHDGQWIYFSSLRTGSFQVWKVRPSGGPPEQITTNGGRTAFESIDARWIYYVKSDAPGPIWRIAATGGTESIAVEGPVVRRGFAITASGIYFLKPVGDHFAIAHHAYAGSVARDLITITKPTTIGLSITPDEKYAFFGPVDRISASIMVVDNFR
jgi:Tol biopolymer transport system component